jgi:riboflavin synthase
MFTGIILAIGNIAQIEAYQGDYRLKILTGKLPLEGCQLGDSIAVDGVCLTATELGNHYFCADVSNETLSRTTLKTSQIGQAVNLELALTPSTRMGGHIVSGHVDGIGKIVNKQQDARSIRLTVEVPPALAKYIATKGSICINGISLTVNTVAHNTFTVNIVPHTLGNTTLSSIAPGVSVNLEVDVLARYLERLLESTAVPQQSNNITEALLRRSGF